MATFNELKDHLKNGDLCKFQDNGIQYIGYLGNIVLSNGNYTFYFYADKELTTRIRTIELPEDNNDKVEVIKSISSLNNNNMNIQEKFVLAITKEPNKSFRKAGVTNGDDILTDEGAKVFLSWLLHSKYAEEFKTAVVDDMLKEAEAKK